MIFVLLGVTLGQVSLYAQNMPPEGVWLHSNERIQVRIGPCEENLCGKIIWLKNPDGEKDSPIADSENPDPDQRGRPVIGMTVLWGLVRNGADLWTEGTIYNPDDGKTYSARITMASPDRLSVQVYKFLPLFGETQVWTRVGD